MGGRRLPDRESENDSHTLAKNAEVLNLIGE